MGWAEDAIWWHVYPLGFCGAPIRDGDRTPTPRLLRLIPWLNYVVELGATGLLLGPIFTSKTHGYDSLDQFSIDPRLGDDQDFADLVRACQARNLRIVLDGVFSHVSSEHPDLIKALNGESAGAGSAKFDIEWENPAGPTPRIFEGHDSLARLDHTSSQTVNYVQQVMEYWLERGIDGWRLDAAYSVSPQFWGQVLPRVREQYSEAWFLGEVIHGNYPEFVAESGVDSVTQYQLWKAIWSSLNDRNLFELDWALRTNNDFLDHFVPNTFIGNHDVTRIASTLGQQKAITALSILMTVGGIPSVYAGDEQGFVGIKEERIGGDDDIRPPFPDSPWQLAGWGHEIYAAHQQLISLRRSHKWLSTAKTATLHLENTQISYRTSSQDPSVFLDVIIDLEQSPTVIITDESQQILWSQK